MDDTTLRDFTDRVLRTGDFADRSALQLLNQNPPQPHQPAPHGAHDLRGHRAERQGGPGLVKRSATTPRRSDPGIGR